MKFRLLILTFFLFNILVYSQDTGNVVSNFIYNLKHEKEGYFALGANTLSLINKNSPIGIFDSGTGGLTVLNSIFSLDSFYNFTDKKQADGVRDFNTENFIYLGDLANMPYGNYAKEDKTTFLQELIIKDIHFLINNQYYHSKENPILSSDKLPVKTIVIACNTASAYGMDAAKKFLEEMNFEVKVIGVIDAGVKAALDNMETNKKGIVGVLATEGTVMSGGYQEALKRLAEEREIDISVVSQGGRGIAESLDGDKNYYIPGKDVPDDAYKGPAIETGEIKKELLSAYNFDFSANRIVCDNPEPSQCERMQINDPENYMRYHLVSLLENIRKQKNQDKKLKTIILGCTHYPYMKKEINHILNELYELKSDKGDYVYRDIMSPSINLIDPSVYTAIELYAFLQDNNLLSELNNKEESSFYVSIPNLFNENIQTDKNGGFTYDYKYGRDAGSIEEYVIRVPFLPGYFEQETLMRMESSLPMLYPLLFEKMDR